MKLATLGLVTALAAGLLAVRPPSGAGVAVGTPAPAPLVPTELGHALRVGPADARHLVGLLANGAGAVGVAVAPDGAFLAYTCAMRPQADAWFAGDWYRGTLVAGEAVEVAGDDGERLGLTFAEGGGIEGSLASAAGDELPISVAPARAEDGLFRRDDADGVLGAVALPGNTVCAVKRTSDGRFLPAGTVPY